MAAGLSAERTIDPTRPVVFLGPSALRKEALAVLPSAIVLPPVSRGDLYDVRARGAETIVVVDGVFSHQLAISPREVVDVLADGARVHGASSMGALRAAECWPAGARGHGLVYRLFRLGVLDSDDEVAVATDPARNYCPLSVALINVRFATSRATRARRIDRGAARRIVEVAVSTFFSERRWRAILSEACSAAEAAALLPYFESFDLKRDDALGALRAVAEDLERQLPSGLSPSPGAPGRFARAERYPGHDRFLGRPPRELRGELLRWLFGSGRYQKYIWALVAGAPEVGAAEPEETRAASLRDRLPSAIARLLSDPDTFGDRVGAELDFLDELDAELIRWEAVRVTCRIARQQLLSPSAGLAARVREEIAIAHGVRDYRTLERCVEDGRLFGALPFEWVIAACEQLAMARALAGQQVSPAPASGARHLSS